MQEYNGWASYETWAVNLEVVEDLVHMWIDDGERFPNTYRLRDSLKNAVEDILAEECNGNTASLAFSWAMRSLAHVSWDNIADHYADDLVVSDSNDEEADGE